MKITCIDKEIKKVFETGYYHIPRFQRPYSWEKDHIAEFLNDTLIENETDYFIGSIVLYKINADLFGVVDGQQRLTTITMILCALRDFYLDENHVNLAQGVHRLIEKVDLNNDSKFVLQTETSYPYFQEHIQKFEDPELAVELGNEEINLKNGFEQLTQFIKNELDVIKSNSQLAKEEVDNQVVSKLNEIRDKILKLKVIDIELDDEDDAYIIFETLNTRGKDLSVGDLVKNYLTKHIKASNKNVDVPKEKWNMIRNNIDSTAKDLDLDTFLLHVWLSKYEYTTAKTLFKKLKKTIKASQSKSFMDELVIDSGLYKNIFDVETRKWNKNETPLKKSLKTLYGFNVTQQTPMVLSVIREYNAGNLKFKYAKEVLQSIEHFHYIFTAITSQRSSGGIASMYSLYGRKLSSATNDTDRIHIIRELRMRMREKIPTYDEFLAAFRTLKFTNGYTKQKRIIHYTLSKFDEYYNKNGSVIDYDLMTIEHLMSQSVLVKNPSHDLIVGQVGNLVLVDEKTNNILGAKSFTDKKAILAKTNLYLDPFLQTASEWTITHIEQRTADIANKAFKEVFKI